jgi:hypothetical protein
MNKMWDTDDAHGAVRPAPLAGQLAAGATKHDRDGRRAEHPPGVAIDASLLFALARVPHPKSLPIMFSYVNQAIADGQRGQVTPNRPLE